MIRGIATLCMMAMVGVSMADAQTPAPLEQRDPLTVRMYWENDGGPMRFDTASDRYYTNGAAMSITHQPQWAADLAPHMPFADAFGPAKTGAGYVAGQLMFTPDDINTAALVPDERPYAGYLYGGVFWQRANANTLDHFEFNLGLVGTSSGADELQDYIHALVSTDEPLGWGNQLHDEVTFQFHLRKKWRSEIGRVEWANHEMVMQLIPQAGAAVGTVQRHLEGAATLRFGANLPDDFGPSHIGDMPTAPGSMSRGLSAYAFARVGMRIVEHNLFIEGNTWRSSHGRQAEVWVGDITMGASVGYHSDPWAVDLTWSHTWRTHEFEGQKRDNDYAALNLAVTYWF